MLTLLGRRALLVATVTLPAWAREAKAPVLLMRHAQTTPGVGDPPGFVLQRCATQRNLSPEGRAQARAFGARLAALGLQPAAIRSSRWCRCLHTADEIGQGLGRGAAKPEAWTALDSFFDDRSREPQQSAQLRERVAALRGPAFELWVTHQVNITALTGASAQMGQALWISRRADGGLDATPFE
jgi:phosphohistidine phosphatase SixA